MLINMQSCWWLTTLVVLVAGAGWRWPEGVATLRIDTKVRFVDDAQRMHKEKQSTIESDEPYREATEYSSTRGNFDPRAQRLPPPVYPDQSTLGAGGDGTLDSLQFCKCVSTPDCNPRPESAIACGYGKFLCCYKRSGKTKQQNSEFFNEIDDERPMLFPGKENIRGPFPPPPGSGLGGVFGPGHGHETVVIGSVADAGHRHSTRRPVLTGPGGPTGVIGPQENHQQAASAQRGILVGPGGPTGIIGPYNGPKGGRPVLVGPGGPTGIVGPRYGRQQPLLVGPGGPSGILRPGRHLLVGPGGPSGFVGPRHFIGQRIHRAHFTRRVRLRKRGTTIRMSRASTIRMSRASTKPNSRTEGRAFPWGTRNKTIPVVRREAKRRFKRCAGDPNSSCSRRSGGGISDPRHHRNRHPHARARPVFRAEPYDADEDRQNPPRKVSTFRNIWHFIALLKVLGAIISLTA